MIWLQWGLTTYKCTHPKSWTLNLQIFFTKYFFWFFSNSSTSFVSQWKRYGFNGDCWDQHRRIFVCWWRLGASKNFGKKAKQQCHRVDITECSLCPIGNVKKTNKQPLYKDFAKSLLLFNDLDQFSWLASCWETSWENFV